MRYLRGRADELNIDSDRIAMSGCSAGARTTLWAAFAQGNGVGEASSTGASQLYANESSRVHAIFPVSGDLWAPTETLPVIKPDNVNNPALLIIAGVLDGNPATVISTAYELEKLAKAAGVYTQDIIIPDGGHCPFYQLESRYMVCCFALLCSSVLSCVSCFCALNCVLSVC